jgi:serine/threonine protein phosphatase PrpC
MQSFLSNIYCDADKKFCEQAVTNGWRDGCTACSVLMIGHNLYTMNAGDSKAVLCRLGKPIPLTEDHKPGHPSERQRIEAAGGTASVPIQSPPFLLLSFLSPLYPSFLAH